MLTDRHVADITELRTMLERFEGGTGNFCLDSAYLIREICNAISDRGMVPRIRPKSIMFRPAILRNYEFHGQRGAAAAPEHQASGRPCQSEPNLMEPT